MGQITLQGVRKSFGPVNIIKDANLDIEDGSFVVFVGPSGCGKTTLLRLIAGLEDVTGGQILIDGRNVVDVPPAKRGLSMVFQSYALYPHMSVRGNIAFGLKMAGLPRPEIDRKVEAAAATLNLTPYLDRKPRELSGGQRQRVAIGRAIVREPKAFLFDEPLSNLDAALRVQMRLEVTKLQKQLGTTAVYVTHDQVEAMTMADKIVVLNAGRIEQYGSPLELYERPANLFVAGFIGSPKMNFVSGEAAGEPGVATLGVRPEHLKVGKEGEGWPGTVSVAEHLGSDTFLYVDAGKLGMLTARCIGEFSLKAGDRPACTASTRMVGSSGPERWRSAQKRRASGATTPMTGMQTGRTKMYLEKFRLDRKTAVVTGAGQGIGLACAEALAEAGAKVVIADRDPKAAETGRASLQAKGLSAEVVMMDVTDAGRVGEVADQLVSRYGGIDILVNNAGIARSETPAEKVTDEHWLNVVDVNLNGTFWCCRAFGKHMLDAKSGSIVNIGSMSGFIVNKPQEQCYYNASKAAVHHLTKSLAAEWGARGVRVNAVAPTYVATPLNAFVKNSPQMYDAWIGGTPMARMGEVDEVASVVLFLASDAASLMTGSVVLVDGGYTCW
jgi:multiple sugar transport system ATP-binding protein